MRKAMFLIMFIVSTIVLATFVGVRTMGFTVEESKPEAWCDIEEEEAAEEGGYGSAVMTRRSMRSALSVFELILSYIKEILSVVSMVCSLVLFLKEIKKKKIPKEA